MDEKSDNNEDLDKSLKYCYERSFFKVTPKLRFVLMRAVFNFFVIVMMYSSVYAYINLTYLLTLNDVLTGILNRF